LTVRSKRCVLRAAMNPLTEKNRELVKRFDRWLLVLKYSPIISDIYTKAARDYLKFLGEKFCGVRGAHAVLELLGLDCGVKGLAFADTGFVAPVGVELPVLSQHSILPWPERLRAWRVWAWVDRPGRAEYPRRVP
jgi:hypothetical protein